jgi:hypothetical protein
MSTRILTAASVTAACAVVMFPVAAKVLPDPVQALAASFAGSSTAMIIQKKRNQKNRRYKQYPLPPSDFITASPPPPPAVGKNPLTPPGIVWPETGNFAKTKRFLIVPEGYDAETLASEPFRAALQRYQRFLQQHFPAELITVGIAYPEQSIPSVTPDAEYAHLRPTRPRHPLLAETDALLILVNGEKYSLFPHANFYYQTAVSWGPSATGVTDFDMIVTALHECLHLCPVSSEAGIYDSYEHDLSPLRKAVDSFNHSGFLPYVPREAWPDTLVTRAIEAFDMPLFPYTLNNENYWAVSKRENIMDCGIIRENPFNLAAFLFTRGKLVEPYQRYLVCHGTIKKLLEDYQRITPDEAAVLSEQFSPDNIKASAVPPLYYLAQSFKDR